MKHFTKLLLVFLFLAASHAFAQNSLKVMTFNIRFDNPADGKFSWENRKNLVVKTIKAHAPDLLCIQEGLISQVTFLEKSFPGYTRTGVGRDDGKESGEFSAVYFNNNRFKQMENSTFWLSQTPEVAGSLGWDGACNRVCTWIKLKDNKTGNLFFVFNTHFDHVGEQARREGAKLILQRVDKIAGNNPFVITGDFNGTETSVPYQTLMASTNPKLSNTRYNTKNGSTGPDCSFIGFNLNFKPGNVIDHIFVNSHSESLRYQIIDDNDAGFYPSDHLPVMAEIVLKK